MSRRVFANLVVFIVIFGVMCVWAVQNVVTIDRIEQPYEIDGDFVAAAGVSSGAEVTYLGVHYGRVGTVDLIVGGVQIEMLIDRERRIPVGSVARIFRKSAIGEPYIDFQPPPGFDPDVPGVEYYEEGDDVEVPMDLTRTPLEFSELLRTASDLLSHVDPERLDVLIHELAVALDDRAEILRDLTIAGSEVATTFAERTEILDRLAQNQTTLTHVLADHRTSISSSITDLSLLADSLANASGDTRILLDEGTELLATVDDLVVDVRPDLDCLLANLVTVNEVAAEPEQLAGLTHFLQTGPAGFGLLARTRDFEPDGVWVRVNLELVPENPPPAFVPPRDLPPTVPIPPCPGQAATAAAASTAAAVGPRAATDFVPADFLLAEQSESVRVAALAAALVVTAASGGVGAVVTARAGTRRRRAGGPA